MSDEFDEDFAEPIEGVNTSPTLAADFTESKQRDLPNSPHVIFDIETGPAWHPGDSIDAAKEYCQPLGINYDPASIGEHPGEWDYRSVKVGNLKDPAKIEEKLDEARRKHAQACVDYTQAVKDGEPAFWQSIIDKAALSPVTGRVLAIGSCEDGVVRIDHSNGSESILLGLFWRQFEACRSDGNQMIGWNIAAFDVPFIVWRSAKLGVEMPRGVYRGRWLCDTFVDLMNYWPSLHSPWKQSSSLLGAKDAARFLGCERPADEIEGKDFWKYFLSDDATKRDRAIAYLARDVTEETIIAKSLGVI